MVYRVAGHARSADQDHQDGRLPHLSRGAGARAGRPVPAHARPGRCEHGIEPEFEAQRRWLDAYWERSDVVSRRPARAAAGRPLEPLPGRPGHGPGRAVRRPGQGRDRLRLRRPLLLGHRDLRAAVPHLHLAADGPQRAALPLQHARRRPRAGPRTSRRAGALFPWRTINGEEASAYYAAGTAQYHIDADIAYALCKYVAASGDHDFMNREGVDILVETARMWADLGFWRENGDGRPHLPHPRRDRAGRVHHRGQRQPVHQRDGPVQPGPGGRAAAPAGARRCPRPTSGSSSGSRSAPDEIAEWAECAEAMAIPYDQVTGINPQDSHFLDREVWDLKNTPAEQAAAAAALPPAGDLPLPGAEAGRRRAGAVPAGRPLHAGAEAGRLRVLRPDHHR